MFRFLYQKIIQKLNEDTYEHFFAVFNPSPRGGWVGALLLFPTLLLAQKSTDVQLANHELCRVTFYSPSIVRIEKYAEGSAARRSAESLVVTMQPEEVAVSVKRNAGRTQVASKELQVSVDHRTGQRSVPASWENLAEGGCPQLDRHQRGSRQG